VLLLLFLPSVAVLAQSQQTKLATRQGFTVSLPLSVNPETVKIHAGVYGGKGLSLSEVQTKPGVYDYTIDVANSGVGPAVSICEATLFVESLLPIQRNGKWRLRILLHWNTNKKTFPVTGNVETGRTGR
jgi:hypothetical protein